MGIVAKNIVKKDKVEQKQEVVIEAPVVEDTNLDNKRQPSSKWLSIKESDYVSHLIK
jgi:hypothetical protein